MNSKKLMLAFIVILSNLTLLSAKQTEIQGKISDVEDDSPISFATVLLLRQDSTLIQGISSDMDGFFSFPNIEEKDYLISVSYLGYRDYYTFLSVHEPAQPLHIQLQPLSREINEVTVAARRIIRNTDRQSILPSKTQVESSVDGLDLLSKLQLPRIIVDPISGEVFTSQNGEVQLRINGVLVGYGEIAALNPDEILRIEYHDDPGIRYGDVAAVIDYITRKKEAGGSIRGGFMHNIGGSRTSIDNMLAGKYNRGKSEVSVNARFVQRKGDWTREYDEKFFFSDYELHRVEAGEPTLFNKKLFTSNINYSFLEKDEYFFSAQFRYIYLDFPASYNDRKSKLYISDNELPLSIYDHSTEKSNSPALDLYFQQYLKNDQLLIFNVVGTYIDTKSNRIYQELRQDIPETDIFSDISGNKYSLIGEGIYEKKLGEGKLTGGIKHIQSYTDNEYLGSTIADVSLRQAESFVYAEYQGKIRHFGYMVNLAGSRFYYSQANGRHEKYMLQPSARFTYTPTNDMYFRYRIHLKNNAPAIAYLNNVEQLIDGLQVRRGNPDLDSYLSLNQYFNAGCNKGWWSVDALVGYLHEYKPIMESIFLEDGLFVRTYKNQKSFENLSAEVTFRIKPWKDYISLSVSPKLNRYISKGNDYLHTYTMKEIRFNLDFSYKNWIANFTTITPPDRYVYGEQLLKGQLMDTFTAGYKKPEWSLMAGIHNPFIKTYRSENENWSALNPVKSEIHSGNMTRTFLIRLNINLNFGKQSKGVNRIVNNADNDPGIISGGKQ
ncbi:MAG: carboxypeptidase-like regulatory domain-containing protein [Candidatus Azobacteroides sp.]|nr:carboxypeptidase-like regulatory domain-containing protein [Candidatus Azobacteroides sp.]